MNQYVDARVKSLGIENTDDSSGMDRQEPKKRIHQDRAVRRIFRESHSTSRGEEAPPK